MVETIEYKKAVIIGSGFGGSIAAYRLGNAGVETTVLERGRKWDTDDNQNTFSTYRNPDGRSAWLSDETVLFEPKKIDKFTGILDRFTGDGIIVWMAAGVGGGSLVYNTVLLKPNKENFESVFKGLVDYEDIEKYYDRVAGIMHPNPIPQDVLDTDYYLSTRVFIEQAEKAGLHVELLNIASDWDLVRQEIKGEKKPSAIDGEIWYGINSGVKRSLDKNYLKMAIETGNVDVCPLHVVNDIFENPEGGFIISYDIINERGDIEQSNKISCTYLFMAAGSIGSSKLLVKGKYKGTLSKLNENVGKFWGNNGDTFATRKAGLRTNPGQGGPASAVILHHDNPISPQTIIVFPEWDAPEGTLTSLGMTIPEIFGEFGFNSEKEEVTLFWPGDSAEAKKMTDSANYTYSLLDEALEEELHPNSENEFHSHFPTIQYPEHDIPRKTAAKPKTESNGGITAHPLGGLVIGKATDNFGRIHGYEGLYVVDGAFIPGSAAAANPAFTIAAFAERNMENIISNDINKK
ncbi:MAG: cholesterol oxidase [Ignavibacteria bacterium]|nr:cholesterol oxidase [Ignavibacteria bacterium]